MNYPRGFGPKVASGHSIELSDGTMLYSKSLNTRYVLSAFKGYANANPKERMILRDSEGPIARAVDGDVFILSVSVYV